MRNQVVGTLGCLLFATGLAHAGALYSDHVLYNTDPTVYWKLDETSGATARDAATVAGGANNATYVNTYTLGTAGPRPADGLPTMSPANNALSVMGNGAASYTSLSTTAGISTSAYSYQMWFNSSVDAWSDRMLQYLFNRGNGTADADRRDSVYIGGSYVPANAGKLSFYPGSEGTTEHGIRVLDRNRWYHLVFVRDDSDTTKAKVYVNGKLEITSTAAWLGGAGEHLAAGKRTDGHTSLGTYGRFDEVAVWNRPLGEAEAKNLYYSALGSPYLASVLRRDPAAYWRLEETMGTNTAYDFTGNGHSFNYQASPKRTGTGGDVGPRPTQFGGLPADNKAPTLIGGPLVDATNGYLGIVSNVLPGTPGGVNNDYSVEMWFRRGDDPNAYNDYFMHRNDAGATANTGDFLGVTDYAGTNNYKLFVYNGTASATGTTVLQKGDWHQVGMARQGDNVRVYLDGLLEINTSLACKTGTTWTAGTWTFGGRRDLPTQQKFAGNLDEIAIYGSVLSGQNFQENYLSAIVRRDAPYAKTVLSFSPESYWRLDEVDPYTLAIDATGRGHTFTYQDTPSRTGTGSDVGPQANLFPGFEADNKAPRLTGGPLSDATDGYLGIVNNVLGGAPGGLNNDYTVQMWFRRGDDPNAFGDYLVHRSDPGAPGNTGDYLSVSNYVGDEFYLGIYAGNESVPNRRGTTTLSKDQWYHVTMTRTGNDVKLYLNGQLEVATTMPSVVGASWATGTWTFGGRLDLPGQQKFAGNIDEIAIYGQPLGKFQVQASYLSALGRDECHYSDVVLGDGPEAYWRLNETSQWVAAMDSSGNAHHFEYCASTQRTAADLGPRPDPYGGFEAGNRAPRLTGGPLTASDGYLGIVSGVLPGQNDYTVEMWFSRDTVGSLGAYLMHRNDLDATGGEGKGDFLGLHQGDQAGEVNLFTYDGSWPTITSLNGATDILQDRWYHLAMVRQGSEVLVYLNGELEIQGTMNVLAGTKWIDGTWAFGGRIDLPTLDQRFAGSLDEIAIYGRVLSREEIFRHFMAAQVPEPSSWILLGLGGAGIAMAHRKWRRRTGTRLLDGAMPRPAHGRRISDSVVV